MTTYEKLKAIVEEMEVSGNITKFESGERGYPKAGANLRKSLQEIKTISQNFRKEIQDTINARKEKK